MLEEAILVVIVLCVALFFFYGPFFGTAQTRDNGHRETSSSAPDPLLLSSPSTISDEALETDDETNGNRPPTLGTGAVGSPSRRRDGKRLLHLLHRNAVEELS